MMRPAWVETVCAGVLAVAVAAGSWACSRQVPGALIMSEQSSDVWFESDLPRVFTLMSTRYAGAHHRYHTRRHPLFVALTLPAVKAAERAAGLERLTAVRAVMAAIAALWAAALFALLRLLGCRRHEAAIFTGLAASSAAAVFWLAVPETWGLGSVSILAPLLVVAAAGRRRVGISWWVAASAASLSVTVTNWMSGVLAACAALPRRRALQVSVAAFCAVTLLWGAQKLALPQLQSFLSQTPADIRKYMLQPDSGGPGRIASSFLFHSMVAPAITHRRQTSRGLPQLTVQYSPVGSGGPLALPAVLLWAALLAAGVWGLAAGDVSPVFRRALLFVLFAQFVLHQFYGGEETFLYALHWLPLLVTVAACAVFTPARRVAVAAAAALALLAGVHNVGQFRRGMAQASAIVFSAPAAAPPQQAAP